ncbi:type II toxin-antitoxin system RelE/ParE family toxin [Lederbergia sp. NSJ-179]|uniref:type II toxin-antitoxin system RelE/ParE family toxin n=1 Tax=Lederbergia sp. NSJ-179 TaxID=2931402 RepID=UPI001FD23379|nr:type II toxin-antitoxin system RelE/ParE family toxin [Lederbergia sp. NSJ-179]MCJ7840651.1 type II toxin-antitoxin system RelE/ParE family toxin [Lederbergia sp. NSJ-179]
MSKQLPIKISKRAGKDLKKIQRSDQVLFRKISKAIEDIRKNPFIGEAKKGDLKGCFCLDIHHVGTNYELCYSLEELEDGQVVLILLMGPRENFYSQLKRYLDLT